MQAIIDRLSHRYDATLLNALAELPAIDPACFADRMATGVWLERLTERLNRMEAGARFILEPDYTEQPEAFRVRVSKRLHGVYKIFELGAGFFQSSDYRRLAAFAEVTDGLFGSETYIAADERREYAANFRTAFDWLMAEAKRGQHIQRYKGLGEMNPDQLFETTLDANTRRLLQVRIEDAIAADEVFTTLMGDQVEPRRDFIERNALEVSNLDV